MTQAHSISAEVAQAIQTEFNESKFNPSVEVADFGALENPTPRKQRMFIRKSANQCVADGATQPMPKMLFDCLWMEGEVCILFASQNLGKSLLAVNITDSITKGVPIDGMRMDASKQAVLYFDFELSDKQFEMRAYNSSTGKHYKFSDLFYRCQMADVLSDEYITNRLDTIKSEIENEVEESGVKIFVIDNITWISSELHDAKMCAPLMMWLHSFARTHGVSILVLAHTPKRNILEPLQAKDLAGSHLLSDFADSMFAIGQSSQAQNRRYLIQLKARSAEYKYGNGNVAVFDIVQTHTLVRYKFVGCGPEADHLKNDPQSLIDEAVRMAGSGVSQREIAKQMGMSVGKVNKWIHSNDQSHEDK